MFWSFNRSKANEELSYIEMNTDHYDNNNNNNDDDELGESEIYDYEVDKMIDPHRKNNTSSSTQDIQKILNRPKITELKTEFSGDVPDYMKRFSSGKIVIKWGKNKNKIIIY